MGGLVDGTTDSCIGESTKFFEGTTPPIDDTVAQEILAYDVTHHNGGVSVFHNVLDMSRWDELEPWIEEQSQIAHANRWTWKEDVEGNTYALNEDNNKFTAEQVDTAPIRILYCVNQDGMEGHDPTPIEFVKVFRDWEDTVYKCLLGYIDKYPYIVNQLWWRTRGHFMKYKTTGFIGPHADCDSNYRTVNGKRFHPHTEFPTRQTVSVTAYLNSSGEDYTGGNLYFPYLDVDLACKQGDVCIFPANFMGLHEVRNVESGIRHAYLIAFGQGTDPRTHDGELDVKEPDQCSMWTPPTFLNDLHDDYAHVFHRSPTWDIKQAYYNPIAQNRPLEGAGLDQAGGDRFTDEEAIELMSRADPDSKQSGPTVRQT